MLYGYYKLFVQERAGLRTEQESENAIRAVFEALDMILPVDLASQLAETVPIEVRDYLGKNLWRTSLDGTQFLQRIARKEDIDAETAETHARAVLSVLAEFLPSPELLITLQTLPPEIRSLFSWAKKAA